MFVRRLFVVAAFVVIAASFGVPSQVSAAPGIPKSLESAVRIASSLAPGSSKTVTVSLPWRANMAGISFVGPARGAGVALEVRSHDGAGWTGWEPLDESDNGGDGIEAKDESARITTEPLWLGTADGLQVRVAVASGARAIHDIRVHLINTLGNAKPSSILASAWHAFGGFLRQQGNTRAASAAPTQPTIISRAQWGADPRLLNLPCPGFADQVKMVIVHHTDTPNSYSRSTSAAMVRGIYRYHTNTRGYCDIAYNFLVDKYGQVFEGRNGGITKPVIGAHSLGLNQETVGVALLGTFTSTHPSSAMISALDKLIAWRMDIAHIPPVGKVTMTYRADVKWKYGTQVSLNRIIGHRDEYPTSCPGNQVYRRLPDIRDAVNKIGRPKIYLPTQSTSYIRPDGDGSHESVTFKAPLSNSAHWRLTLTDPSGTVRLDRHTYGSSILASWNGLLSGGGYAPLGRYTWTMTASDSSGHSATPASGSLYVITSHPNGTLLQDPTGKYVLDSGAVRTVGATVYVSNFGTSPAVATGTGERSRYGSGSALGLREGTLFVDQNGQHYIWSDGGLRQFIVDNHGNTQSDPFQTLGYQSAAALPVTTAYLQSLATGPDVTSSDLVHPDGTAVYMDLAGVRHWYIADGGAFRPATSMAFRSWYRAVELVAATAADIAIIQAGLGPVFPVRDGTFIKPQDGGAPWLVSDGVKHRFVNATFASLMGYTSAMMRVASPADIAAIPTGARIG